MKTKSHSYANEFAAIAGRSGGIAYSQSAYSKLY